MTDSPPTDLCDVCHTYHPLSALTTTADAFNPETVCPDCISRFITTGHWREYTIVTAYDNGVLHRIEDTAPNSPIILTSCNKELTGEPERHPDTTTIDNTNENQCPNCNWISTAMYGAQ